MVHYCIFYIYIIFPKIALAQVGTWEKKNVTLFSCSRDLTIFYSLFLGDVAARIDTDAKLRVDSMNSSVNANKNKVITDLMEAVCKIEPKVHANYRPWTHLVF